MKVQAGEIWLIKFHPGTGSELSKYRPAVVLADLNQIDDRFALIAPLTSDTKIRNEWEIPVYHECLEKPSLALTWYLWTIDRRRLVSKLGALSAEELALLRASLNQL